MHNRRLGPTRKALCRFHLHHYLCYAPPRKSSKVSALDLLLRGLRTAKASASLPSSRESAVLYFPPSFVLSFAREPIAATSITQASFRFSTSLRPSRCGDERAHPCFASTTEGGKRIFNTNESKDQTRRGHRRTSLTSRIASKRDSSRRDVSNFP